MISLLTGMVSRLIALVCRLILLAAIGSLIAGVIFLCSQSWTTTYIVLGFIAILRLRRRRKSGDAYGSARLASLPEMELAGLLADDGIMLGRAGVTVPPTLLQGVFGLINPFYRSDRAVAQLMSALFPRWGANRILRTRRFTHLLTVAPAGKGKSTSVLVPNLRSYRGASVVVDPKGELYNLTARHRKRRFGHRIIRLDPFGICGPASGSDTLNPLDFLDPRDPDFIDQVRDLANMLVVPSANATDPHWNDSAELNLAAFIAFTRACEENPTERHLNIVREFVASPGRFQQAVTQMQAEGDDGIRRFGDLLTWFQDKELNSVMTTVQRHTAWMDSPLVAANMRRSSFDPALLRKGPATIYLCLPSDKLTILSPLMRMWLGIIIRVITRGPVSERSPVMFFIDEAAHLGRMKVLEDAITLMRGMGVRLWYFVQSLDQMKKCFGEHFQTALDNFDIQQYFGITSYETAKTISERIGDSTIQTETSTSTRGDSYSTGRGRDSGGGNRSSSHTVNRQEIARKLLKPEEIIVMDGSIALTFVRNLPVIPARMLHYFNAPEFRWGRSGKGSGLGLRALAVTGCLLLIGYVLSTMPDLMSSSPPPGPSARVPGRPMTAEEYRNQIREYRKSRGEPLGEWLR